ncbi:glycoside hydrolase [Mesorhizobium sp. B292B1B]|uniref:sialidase family protein n=1 Tax=unclassified Mesorhizobium TaxID=325217 RepID=UPI00112ABBF7|nr:MULTISPECIES: sialidase family protein [unclassified Mesorhizobium]MCA0010705.1 glycoside hydrolase [Mesorhizobium sp. B294B1A1]MCA0036101.1 glycoside hydrolase [Mesorhizobium sp. B292B1B]TPM49190.1 exo-alpha-sialidase [Mesorhizobium sp. B2-3-2]
MIKKLLPPRFATDTEHAVLYRRENEFASHPFSRGFWETAAGHLICNFSVAAADYSGDPRGLAHHNLIKNPGGRRGVTIRSEDRGRTWHIWNEDRNRPGMDVRSPQPGIDGKPGGLAEIGPIDFTDRDVLVSNFYYQYTQEDPQIRDFVPTLTTAFGPPDNQVFFRISKDAGQTWSRSAMLPLDGLYSLSAVESSLVRPDGRCLLFLTGGETSKGQHNRFPAGPEHGAPNRPLVYRSTEDGTEFHFLSFITPRDDPDFSGMQRMYPRGIMLPSGRIVCTLRVDRNWSGDMWTEAFKSDDGGQTWQFLSRVNDFGAPGSPVLLNDGRLVVVYTYRLPPYGMRAIVSEDEGETWGPEIIIRGDGGSWDIGYPRAWEVEPGRVGTVYHYNDINDPIQVKPADTLWGAGGVRYIARSIFSVD